MATIKRVLRKERKIKVPGEWKGKKKAKEEKEKQAKKYRFEKGRLVSD